MPVSVVVLGKGDLAIKICEWFLQRPASYSIAAVVPCIPEPDWCASLVEYCFEKNLTLIDSGKVVDLFEQRVDLENVDLMFSVFYKRKIPPSVIAKCKKVLNLHLAPLPRYRGVRSINWALKNNETEHGVTIHEVNSEFDGGNVVSQLKFSIYPYFEEVEDVYSKALDYAFLLFKNTIPVINSIQAWKQDESESSYYSNEDIPRLGDRLTFTRKQSADCSREEA